jgi:intracellular sulfur oxidation DsrE/DsrF family protein
MVTRRTFAAGALALPPALAAHAARSEERNAHRLAIQVSANDPALMTLALNNAVNVAQHYGEVGEEVEIEFVAYGPGLHMLRADTSPVKDRVKSIAQSIPNLIFTACGNTIDNMKKAEGKDIPLLPGVGVFSAGVVRLMELQEKGWSYIKP